MMWSPAADTTRSSSTRWTFGCCHEGEAISPRIFVLKRVQAHLTDLEKCADPDAKSQFLVAGELCQIGSHGLQRTHGNRLENERKAM